jgi:hypothetical protein
MSSVFVFGSTLHPRILILGTAVRCHAQEKADERCGLQFVYCLMWSYEEKNEPHTRAALLPLQTISKAACVA